MTELEYINMRQRQLIVHSILYYQLDQPLWSDAQYDAVSKEMIELKSSLEFKNSQFYSLFADWDGGTGYHLANIEDPEGYWKALVWRLINFNDHYSDNYT